MELNLSQRFNLARARYEVKRMDRGELERACLQQMRKRMLEKNFIQQSLLENQIVVPIASDASDGPELMSMQTFAELMHLQMDEPDDIIVDIDDEGWEGFDEDGYEMV